MLAAAFGTLLAITLAVAWGRGFRDACPPTMLLFFWWTMVATDERFLPASRGKVPPCHPRSASFRSAASARWA